MTCVWYIYSQMLLAWG